MSTELNELLNTYQSQITKLQTEQIVQDILIKAIISTISAEEVTQIQKLIVGSLDTPERDESAENLKTIAKNYLERVFQITV